MLEALKNDKKLLPNIKRGVEMFCQDLRDIIPMLCLRT